MKSISLHSQMAGTVATYELVLLDTIEEEVTPADICDMKSLTDMIVGGD